MTEQDILFERRGALGLVTLNRPQALNALTHDMVLRLERQIDEWAGDEAVATVAIQGAGDKAFCAGGDIRALYDAGKLDGRNNFPFYADEYRVNTKIKRYPKPYISLMDGVVMGGGVGVSIHGAWRVATERTVFAMPETGIGLFPDVGGTFFLPRLPGRLGVWLGLTGSRLKSIDTVTAGVCDIAIHSSDIPLIVEALAEGATLAELRKGPHVHRDGELDYAAVLQPGVSDGALTPQLDTGHVRMVEDLFSAPSLGQLLEKLAAAQTDWAGKQRAAILTKSPFCTALAFRQIQEGAALEFEDCMRLEYRLARACMTHPDFYEGVRAVIIDKDNAPVWSPAALNHVTTEMVDAAFAPLGPEELKL
ncbi:MAG: enoyl-CoA hydratase/isomerase family protein [Pseudomonadota bacterium]